MGETVKRVLLVVDSHRWAWAHMARGIGKYAPSGVSVDVLDQTELAQIGKKYPEDLKSYDSVCHFSWMESPLPTAIKPLPIKRLTTLLASHGFEYLYPPEDKDDITTAICTKIRNRKNAYKWLPVFDRVLCVSDRILKALEEISENGCRVVPGVDCELFKSSIRRSDSGELVVGWCGQRPVEGRNNTKGYREILLPLMALEESRLRFVVNDRDASNALSQEEMISWYREIDVFLSTSCSEGFQMPIIEAMASGKPVIATDVGAANEVVRNHFNGFVVNAWKTLPDAKDVLDQILFRLRGMAERKEEVFRMGFNAAATSRSNYSWSQRAPEWLREMLG